MARRIFIAALLALAFAVPARAQESRTLWPGVTYELGVQFTSSGPAALSILTGPRPGGTTTLAPVLSNETVVGTETLTSMQRRTASTTVSAGVNGDYYTFATGVPSGVFMRDGQVASPPQGARSSAGITADGTLDVRRISFFGTWQGTGVAQRLASLNEPPPATGGVSLYTQAWGLSTPAVKGSVAVLLFPFPAVVPNIDLEAPVVQVLPGGGPVPIPFGGAVLLARGPAASALTAEAVVGTTLRARVIFRPDWPGIVNAIGGGPQIVRDGVPVFRAGEAFLSNVLGPRAPRTAVGQLRDGRIVLLAVDGRQLGYSVGMTNFELAQALVRLGAVTGMALDGGGSTAMAFDGALLNRPSTGHERPVATALMFLYNGVYVQPPTPVVSPDGDGVADRQSLRYRLGRPAAVTVALTAPDGTAAFTEATQLAPGSYDVAFPPAAEVAPPTALPPPVPAALERTKAPQPAQGRWQLSVVAYDDLGQKSEMTQSFSVNSTLGFLRTDPPRLFLPPGGRDVTISWRQARLAKVLVTVERKDGEIVRTLARRRYAAGAAPTLLWNGLGRDRKRVKGGVYVVRVRATNALGAAELALKVPVRGIAGPKPAPTAS